MDKRRKFLGLLTSVAVLPGLPVLPVPALPRLNGRECRLLALLDDVMADNPAVGRLGRKHLDRLASRKAPGEMMRRLFDSLPDAHAAGPEELRRHLAALRQADFEADDLVSMDGWILARSEADAIVLVSLYRAG